MRRIASLEDAPAIATVLTESRRAFLPFAPMTHSMAATTHWVREELLQKEQVFVWEQEGQTGAVLSISVDQCVGWINQLYVLPGWTNNGIGTKLLKHAHRLLPSKIQLFTFQENLGARRFYERHGYRAVEFTNGENNDEKCPDVLYLLTQFTDA